jgi:hypothetical protein
VASRRYRSKSSLNSNLTDINSKISKISKRPDSRKIANEAITSLSIRESTITGQNLADNSITKSKLAADVYNTDGITNSPRKNALIASGYNSASGLFNQASRVVMTATASGSTAPTTRPDGTSLVAGDVWISY